MGNVGVIYTMGPVPEKSNTRLVHTSLNSVKNQTYKIQKLKSRYESEFKPKPPTSSHCPRIRTRQK